MRKMRQIKEVQNEKKIRPIMKMKHTQSGKLE